MDVETDSLLSINYDKYNAKGHYMLGLCYCRKEQWLEGIRSLEKALDTARRQKRPPALLKEFEGAIAAGRYAWHAASVKDDQLIDQEFSSYLDTCLRYVKEKAYEDIQTKQIKQSTNPFLMNIPENMKDIPNSNGPISPPVTKSYPETFLSQPTLSSSSSTSLSSPLSNEQSHPVLSRPPSSYGVSRPSTAALSSSRPGTASTVSRYLPIVDSSSELSNPTNTVLSLSTSPTAESSSSSTSSSFALSPVQVLNDTLEQHYLSRLSSLSELFAERETLRSKRKIPDFFICPITCELMLDPVITPGGHSYERLPLEHYLKNIKGEDPQTRQSLSVSQLVPNIGLKSAIQYFLTEHPWAHPQLPRDPVTGQVSVTGIGPSTTSSNNNSGSNNNSSPSSTGGGST